ncbi:peptidyl-prolyl cis-trans isomerase SlyD, FKBP-type family protein [Leyella stercorea DSM 18206]|uniref:FKBP-type peptidyl-prolyl cis-trans isomerase SlyD n=1 Tax=Leyella stercorea DSM 18206 TaxID=1002367 RepID=G6AVH9_9BACT|nr:FKBP-type peptidyl-prolyl cis-trans isomerase [Leyella stercorea]EHJ41606.1 peptidyl-prolyl cis-trans isomerase SlyD, FKBP-type family protein [Leyella stercorea DSM 18206]
MENKTNKLIAAQYQLFTISDNGERKLVEETTREQPFVFITGFDAALDALEEHLENLKLGEKFDFELEKEKAFGEYEPSRVIELNKEMFIVDGQFDSKNIFKGAQIPLKNEDGNFFIGTVLEIGDAAVKVDLNHPLAGKKLNFKGYIIENREATKDEIKTMLSHMNGGGCGGDCGGCDGGCGHHEGGCGHHDHEDGCCGHHEHKGGCCGHHH